jgi:hypothetical protein
MAERVGLQLPRGPFARFLIPQITAYQTIRAVLLRAYDLVGNQLRAAWRSGPSMLTRHDRKKKPGGKAEPFSGGEFYRKLRNSSRFQYNIHRKKARFESRLVN